MCSVIGTTPGVIKVPKGAVFIRVNKKKIYIISLILIQNCLNLINIAKNQIHKKSVNLLNNNGPATVALFIIPVGSG